MCESNTAENIKAFRLHRSAQLSAKHDVAVYYVGGSADPGRSSQDKPETCHTGVGWKESIDHLSRRRL